MVGDQNMSGVTDFIALDVETANSDYSSICSVGLVHFKSQAIHKSIAFLVDPEAEFSPANIAVHGITPESVAGRPTMDQVLRAIGSTLANCAIAHHSPFDRLAFARAAEKYGAPAPQVHWIDTLQVARHTWAEFKDNGGYGLANLASAFGIELAHHDAAEDARAAGMILLRAIADSGSSLQSIVDEFADSEEEAEVRESGKIARFGRRISRKSRSR